MEVIYEMHDKKAPQPTAEGSCCCKKTSASVSEKVTISFFKYLALTAVHFKTDVC